MSELHQTDGHLVHPVHTAVPTPTPTPSQVIARALVERQSPSQIASIAAHAGLPNPLTRVIVAACCGTTGDREATSSHRRRAASN